MPVILNEKNYYGHCSPGFEDLARQKRNEGKMLDLFFICHLQLAFSDVYYISFRCTTRWLDVYTAYEGIPGERGTLPTPPRVIALSLTTFPLLYPHLRESFLKARLLTLGGHRRKAAERERRLLESALASWGAGPEVGAVRPGNTACLRSRCCRTAHRPQERNQKRTASGKE